MSISKEMERILLKVQKPARYIGGEFNSVIKDPKKVDVRFAFCFPDLYEVGMSHLGMKILYSLKNARDDIWCERVFAPDKDMEEQMRKHEIPLYGLESLEPIRDFDMIGFTLQYEMSFTTILNMLDLAGIPIHSADRTALTPIVIAGGPCACNPEPMADFIDLFVIGEGEEVNLELIDLYRQAKKDGLTKLEFLQKAAQIQGIYVPSLYEVSYNEDNTIQEMRPLHGAPDKVKKRIIKDLDKVYFPESFVVPYIDIVHDRAMLEVLRGCIRGCRFCQAGFIYRPFREKSSETLNQNALNLSASTGYDEISLTSLSTSDYSKIEPLLDTMLSWTTEQKINLALPSLRIDNFSDRLLEQIAEVRKSGLTFAPEAGTQRMRDVINKNISEEEILNTCKKAFEGGYTTVKLYFMMGLPTETDEDIKGIVTLAQKVVDLYYSIPERPKGKQVHVTASVACFVPKPFTPFEFEPQDTREMLRQKQQLLVNVIRSKKVAIKYHDSSTSFIEAVLARGDRRLGNIIETVWKDGAVFDSWDEYFSLPLWEKAAEKNNIDFSFYANRRREYTEITPWEHLDYGVSKRFLIEENKKARTDATTPHCREKCSGCGANALLGGACFE